MRGLRARLWAVRRGCPLPPLPAAGARSFDLADYSAVPAVETFCHAIGYRLITRRDGSAFAVRADVLERLAREAYKLAAAKPAPADKAAADKAPATAAVGKAPVGKARGESASAAPGFARSEEHTSELQSLMRTSYA